MAEISKRAMEAAKVWLPRLGVSCLSEDNYALLAQALEAYAADVAKERDEVMSVVSEMLAVYGDMEDGEGETPGEIIRARSLIERAG